MKKKNYEHQICCYKPQDCWCGKKSKHIVDIHEFKLQENRQYEFGPNRIPVPK